jgi:hypothetical protein
VPIILYLLIKKFELKKVLTGVLISGIIYTISFIPFYPHDFITKSFVFLLDASQGQSPLASVNALNFWYMAGLNKVPDTYVWLISYRLYGIALSVFFIALIIYILRKRISFENTLIAAGLTNFAVCMFLTRIHERHLLPSLVLLLPLALRSKMNFVVYAAVSLIYFVNLYLIWHEKFASFDFQTLEILSFILVASFFYFLVKFFGLKKTSQEV